MAKTTKNILSLTHEEVMDFFMKSEHFHGFELPEYFDFDKVLAYVRESIGDKEYADCLADVRPDDLPNVNLDILLNKDGHYALSVISRMVDSLKDMKEKQDIISKVYNKLCKQHNSDYNQLWLQNITYTQDKKRKKSPYTMRLCQLVMNESYKPLWNNEWLKPDFSKNLPYKSIVNKDTLNKVTPVIVFRETRLYNEHIY